MRGIPLDSDVEDTPNKEDSRQTAARDSFGRATAGAVRNHIAVSGHGQPAAQPAKKSRLRLASRAAPPPAAPASAQAEPQDADLEPQPPPAAGATDSEVAGVDARRRPHEQQPPAITPTRPPPPQPRGVFAGEDAGRAPQGPPPPESAAEAAEQVDDLRQGGDQEPVPPARTHVSAPQTGDDLGAPTKAVTSDQSSDVRAPANAAAAANAAVGLVVEVREDVAAAAATEAPCSLQAEAGSDQRPVVHVAAMGAHQVVPAALVAASGPGGGGGKKFVQSKLHFFAPQVQRAQSKIPPKPKSGTAGATAAAAGTAGGPAPGAAPAAVAAVPPDAAASQLAPGALTRAGRVTRQRVAAAKKPAGAVARAGTAVGGGLSDQEAPTDNDAPTGAAAQGHHNQTVALGAGAAAGVAATVAPRQPASSEHLEEPTAGQVTQIGDPPPQGLGAPQPSEEVGASDDKIDHVDLTAHGDLQGGEAAAPLPKDTAQPLPATAGARGTAGKDAEQAGPAGGVPSAQGGGGCAAAAAPPPRPLPSAAARPRRQALLPGAPPPASSAAAVAVPAADPAAPAIVALAIAGSAGGSPPPPARRRRGSGGSGAGAVVEAAERGIAAGARGRGRSRCRGSGSAGHDAASAIVGNDGAQAEADGAAAAAARHAVDLPAGIRMDVVSEGGVSDEHDEQDADDSADYKPGGGRRRVSAARGRGGRPPRARGARGRGRGNGGGREAELRAGSNGQQQQQHAERPMAAATAMECVALRGATVAGHIVPDQATVATGQGPEVVMIEDAASDGDGGTRTAEDGAKAGCLAGAAADEDGGRVAPAAAATGAEGGDGLAAATKPVGVGITGAGNPAGAAEMFLPPAERRRRQRLRQQEAEAAKERAAEAQRSAVEEQQQQREKEQRLRAREALRLRELEQQRAEAGAGTAADSIDLSASPPRGEVRAAAAPAPAPAAVPVNPFFRARKRPDPPTGGETGGAAKRPSGGGAYGNGGGGGGFRTGSHLQPALAPIHVRQAEAAPDRVPYVPPAGCSLPPVRQLGYDLNAKPYRGAEVHVHEFRFSFVRWREQASLPFNDDEADGSDLDVVFEAAAEAAKRDEAPDREAPTLLRELASYLAAGHRTVSSEEADPEAELLDIPTREEILRQLTDELNLRRRRVVLQQAPARGLANATPDPGANTAAASAAAAAQQPQTTAAAASVAAAQSQTPASDQLWIAAQQPTCAAELCGNTEQVGRLRDWLCKWREVIRLEGHRGEEGAATAGGTRRKGRGSRGLSPASSDSDFYTDSDDSDFEAASAGGTADSGARGGGGNGAAEYKGLPTAFLLRGPAGCGKTAAAYALTSELGFRVLEVNPSLDRSGPQLLRLVGEATRSRRLTQRLSALGGQLGPGAKDAAEAEAVDGGGGRRRGRDAGRGRGWSRAGGGAGRRGARRAVSYDGSSASPCSSPSPVKRRRGGRGAAAGGTTAAAAAARLFGPASKGTAAAAGGRPPGSGTDGPVDAAAAAAAGSKGGNGSGSVTLMLFDEVDVLPDEDKGFLGALTSIVTQSKRPIILTAGRGPLPPAIRSLGLPELEFQAPSESQLLRTVAVAMACAQPPAPHRREGPKGVFSSAQHDHVEVLDLSAAGGDDMSDSEEAGARAGAGPEASAAQGARAGAGPGASAAQGLAPSKPPEGSGPRLAELLHLVRGCRGDLRRAFMQAQFWMRPDGGAAAAVVAGGGGAVGFVGGGGGRGGCGRSWGRGGATPVPTTLQDCDRALLAAQRAVNCAALPACAASAEGAALPASSAGGKPSALEKLAAAVRSTQWYSWIPAAAAAALAAAKMGTASSVQTPAATEGEPPLDPAARQRQWVSYEEECTRARVQHLAVRWLEMGAAQAAVRAAKRRSRASSGRLSALPGSVHSLDDAEADGDGDETDERGKEEAEDEEDEFAARALLTSGCVAAEGPQHGPEPGQGQGQAAEGGQGLQEEAGEGMEQGQEQAAARQGVAPPDEATRPAPSQGLGVCSAGTAPGCGGEEGCGVSGQHPEGQGPSGSSVSAFVGTSAGAGGASMSDGSGARPSVSPPSASAVPLEGTGPGRLGRLRLRSSASNSKRKAESDAGLGEGEGGVVESRDMAEAAALGLAKRSRLTLAAVAIAPAEQGTVAAAAVDEAAAAVDEAAAVPQLPPRAAGEMAEGEGAAGAAGKASWGAPGLDQDTAFPLPPPPSPLPYKLEIVAAMAAAAQRRRRHDGGAADVDAAASAPSGPRDDPALAACCSQSTLADLYGTLSELDLLSLPRDLYAPISGACPPQHQAVSTATRPTQLGHNTGLQPPPAAAASLRQGDDGVYDSGTAWVLADAVRDQEDLPGRLLSVLVAEAEATGLGSGEPARPLGLCCAFEAATCLARAGSAPPAAARIGSASAQQPAQDPGSGSHGMHPMRQLQQQPQPGAWLLASLHGALLEVAPGAASAGGEAALDRLAALALICRSEAIRQQREARRVGRVRRPPAFCHYLSSTQLDLRRLGAVQQLNVLGSGSGGGVAAVAGGEGPGAAGTEGAELRLGGGARRRGGF